MALKAMNRTRLAKETCLVARVVAFFGLRANWYRAVVGCPTHKGQTRLTRVDARRPSHERGGVDNEGGA
jgi:hypothetical protein